MTVYLVMSVMTCAFAFLANLNQTKQYKLGRFRLSAVSLYLFFSAVPMVLVSGLRWNTGIDFKNYYYVFYNIRDNLSTHVEIGFELLCKLILLFTQNLTVLLFICALITAAFTMLSIRINSIDKLMSVFLYLSMGYFFYSMNTIRHFMAISIYLFAFYFMKNRKPIPYFLLILVAVTFHKIALVAIPLYFILSIKYKPYWYAAFVGAAVALMIFHRQILDFIYNFMFGFYKNIEQENSGYSLVNIGITLALSILCYIYRSRLLERSKSNIMLINAAWLGLIFFSLFGWIPVYTRIGQYMTILSLFLIPEIIACEQSEKIRRIYKIGVYVGFTLFLLAILINARNPLLALVPYESMIFGKSPVV